MSTIRKNRTEIILFALLVVWAAFTRFAQLGVGYVKNETAFYQIGVEVFHRQYDTIMTWPYVSSLYCYFCALFFPITGPEMWVFRYVSAALGLLTIILTYLLGKKIYGRKAAYIAAFLLTVSFWQMSLNRQGSLPLDSIFTVGALFLYYKGYESKGGEAKKLIWCALAGVVLGLGAHIKPYLLQIFGVMFLMTLFFEGWKKAIVKGLVAAAASAVVMWPIYLWNVKYDFPMAQIYGSSLGGQSVMGQVHFHDTRKIYEQIDKKLIEYLYALWGSLDGRLSATGPALPGGIPPFWIFPPLFFYGVGKSFYRALKTKSKADMFSAIWFTVNLIVFTFLITWPEDAGEDLTRHRPPRYFNAVYPMPLYMVGIGFVDMFRAFGNWFRRFGFGKSLAAKAGSVAASKGVKIGGGAALAAVALVLSFGMYQKFKAIAPQSAANLDSLDKAIAEKTPDSWLMTNFFIGDLKQVKEIYYPLTYKDFLANDFVMPADGKLNHMDTRHLMFLYPYFLYARAPEALRIVYESGGHELPGIFSLTDLPIYDMDGFERFPNEKTGKDYTVYTILWDKRSGDMLERIIGMHDYPHEFRYDIDMFQAANPELEPERTWDFHGKREFTTFKTPVPGRRYTELALDFGSRVMPAADGRQKVNRGAMYLPWTGFGWKHPYMNEIVYNPNAGADKALEDDGLGIVFVNEFYADVPNGTYDVTITLVNNCHPAADIDAEGERVFSRNEASDACNPYDYGSHSLYEIEFQTRVTDGQLTLRFDPDHEFSPMEHTEPNLGSFAGLSLKKID